MPTITRASITPAMKTFLQAEKYAVLGRTLTDRSKWDNKVLRWYAARSMEVTPVKPDAQDGDEAEGVRLVADITSLPSLPNTSISVIINSKIGLPLLQQLYPQPPSGNEPKAIWFQPGAESVAIVGYVKSRSIEDRVIFGGPCILEDGDMILKEVQAGKGRL